MISAQELEQLSKCVAAKYDVHADTWLHEDSAKCLELAVDHKIYLLTHEHDVVADAVETDTVPVIEQYAEHRDKYIATRVAILRCLSSMKQ